MVAFRVFIGFVLRLVGFLGARQLRGWCAREPRAGGHRVCMAPVGGSETQAAKPFKFFCGFRDLTWPTLTKKP